jgi:Domain of unknown function (DUF397)
MNANIAEVTWRKSSFSGPNGGDCIEVAWRKSSFSGPNGGECVQVAWCDSSGGQCAGCGGGELAMRVRDSKNVGGPVLVFGRRGWVAFVGRLG